MGEPEGGGRVLFHSGSFVALEEALWREVAAVRADDALAPVVVLVPTSLLRRHLTVAAADHGGQLNVHFLTLADVARHLGEATLAAAGRSPLPRLADVLVARSVCRQTDCGSFAAIAHKPGFHRALLAIVQDFGEAGHSVGDLARCLDGSRWSQSSLLAKLRDLHRLWAAYEQRLAELALYDESGLLAAAAQAAPRDPWLERAAAIFVYGFYDLNVLQRRLVAACTARRRARVFFPCEPEAEAFRYARPTFEWFQEVGFEPVGEEGATGRPAELSALAAGLFGPLRDVPGPAGERLRILAAPDETREVRAILRSVVAAARDGVALDRVGVLVRHSDTYAPLFAEECEAGGLDAYHHQPPPLASTRAGRSLLMLLRLTGSDLARADVMDFVTYADIPFDGEPGVADWDLLSIQAGIVKGRASWQERLDALGQKLENEPDEPTRAAELLATLAGLRAFLGRFFAAIEGIPTEGTWAEVVAAVLDVFSRFVRASVERQAVVDTVAPLAALDATGERAEWGLVAQLAREALDGRRPRRARFGTSGPAVVGVMEARGLPFDVVCVPGLVEKGFPAAPATGPLLSDAERADLGKAGLHLPLKSTRAAEEQLLFRLAVGAASHRVVLTLPRLESGTGRERVPSHFLLRAVEAVTGKRCGYRGLETFAGYERIPASAFGPQRPELAWRDAEYDLAATHQAIARGSGAELGYLARISPTFASAVDAERCRWGESRFTEYDGVLASRAALDALADRVGPPPWRVRATDLERYAACPFRYFLSRVLGVEPLEEPETVQRLSGLDRGRLMHDILCDALREARDAGHLPISADDEERILEVAQRIFARFEQAGLVGTRALWDLDRDALLLDLRRFVADEANAPEPYVPAHFEVSFGAGAPDAEGELYGPEGVVLDLGGGESVRIVGRIDRIDVTADGTHARVVDYKTGKAGFKGNALSGGTTLQLPLYIEAAEQLLGGAEVDQAAYRFVTARGDYKTAAFTREALAQRRDDLLGILRTIVQGIRTGRFFAGLGNAPCRNCDFGLICGNAVDATTRRKLDDPAAQDYLAMRDVE